MKSWFGQDRPKGSKGVLRREGRCGRLQCIGTRKNEGDQRDFWTQDIYGVLGSNMWKMFNRLGRKSSEAAYHWESHHTSSDPELWVADLRGRAIVSESIGEYRIGRCCYRFPARPSLKGTKGIKQALESGSWRVVSRAEWLCLARNGWCSKHIRGYKSDSLQVSGWLWMVWTGYKSNFFDIADFFGYVFKFHLQVLKEGDLHLRPAQAVKRGKHGKHRDCKRTKERKTERERLSERERRERKGREVREVREERRERGERRERQRILKIEKRERRTESREKMRILYIYIMINDNI